jgi:hypothetical protein
MIVANARGFGDPPQPSSQMVTLQEVYVPQVAQVIPPRPAAFVSPGIMQALNTIGAGAPPPAMRDAATLAEPWRLDRWWAGLSTTGKATLVGGSIVAFAGLALAFGRKRGGR